MASLYIGLVHYPTYNKNKEIVTTAITNFDIHDIARTARTYGVKQYFLIHHLNSQIELTKEIVGHWQTGFGSQYNPDRREAFSILSFVPGIEQAAQKVKEWEGLDPYIVTTDARKYANTVSYPIMREMIRTGTRPVLLLFGTGWGIEQSVMEKFDYILEPIYGPCDYNHLPVRSAVAVILDRLAGENWWEPVKN